MSHEEEREREEKMKDALLRLDLAAKMREALRDGYGMSIPGHQEVEKVVEQLRNRGFALAKEAVTD